MSSFASAKASVAPMLQESSLVDELGRFDYTNGVTRSTTSIFQSTSIQVANVIGAVELEMDDLVKLLCPFYRCISKSYILNGQIS